ncbi:MAG: acyl-CoA thioesterase [Burkholderiaceae bacterium]|nr:acyl-CoA thioesterase [Burkholderiaceae bacterium]
MKHILTRTVEFGDCDPSGITFHPNFFAWFDAGSLHYFRAAGLPPWRETAKTMGIIGTPIVSTQCDFKLPCRYGDIVEVHTTVEEWRERSFVHRHELRRGDDLLAVATGVRIFAGPHPTDPNRIRAVSPPPSIREICEAPGEHRS